MAANAPGFIANGNINPSTGVFLDTSAGKNFNVDQIATAYTKQPIGVAQDGTYYAPGVAGADGYAAHAGQPITVFGEGEQCLIMVGTGGGVTAGDNIACDGSGNAVTIIYTVAAGHVYQIGVALETAAASTLCRMLVKITYINGITA